MKLNLDKAGNYYSAIINDVVYRYGWYESGRAFIAKEYDLMTYAEAYKTFVPKNSFNMYDYFFAGLSKYRKTIDGIVRYLSDKYNR